MEERMNEHLQCLLHSLEFYFNGEVAVEQIAISNAVQGESLAYQVMDGEVNVFLGFIGNSDAFCTLAQKYTRLVFSSCDEDVMDAVCELTNCLNGELATMFSSEDKEVEMYPPVCEYNNSVNDGSGMYIITIGVEDKKVDLLYSLNGNIKIDEKNQGLNI